MSFPLIYNTNRQVLAAGSSLLLSGLRDTLQLMLTSLNWYILTESEKIYQATKFKKTKEENVKLWMNEQRQQQQNGE